MAKTLKSSVLLSILILSGYCLLSATNQECPSYTSIKGSSADSGLFLNNQASFLKSPSTSGNRNCEFVAELNETEEDKLTHPIKKLKSTTLLDDQISIRNSVSHLSLQKRFSTLSFFESRYILFCDIRI
jgi:hypothetical protein